MQQLFFSPVIDPFPAPFEGYGEEIPQGPVLGSAELAAFYALPPVLRDALEEAADDPFFVQHYIMPTLRLRDPYAAFMGDIGRELALDGVSGYALGDMGFLGRSLRKAVKKVREKVSKVIEKALPKPLAKIHAKIVKAVSRVDEKVSGVVKKVWRKYGNTIIGIAGAVLAPFTGGASLAAASVLTAANKAYETKRMADAAKKQGKKDAGVIEAEAAQQEAALLAEVDAFFNANLEWFANLGITPAQWGQLTLAQKIDIINAGAKGTLPAGIGPVVGTDGGAPPSGGSIPPGGLPPGYIQTPMGPAPAPSGPPGAAPPPEAAAPAPPPGFDLVIEGQAAGTFPDSATANRAALAMTKLGDRFEIIAQGQSTGLRLRTSEGALDVPPELEANIRGLSHEKVVEFVTKAEREAAAKKGGFPWWVLLVGGAVALAA